MGYDIKRFKDNVNEEFCCLLCKNVLKEPVLIESCEHIFCKLCIHQFLENEEKCPIDKSYATLKQLKEPIRSFKKLLGQLEMSCDNCSLGCKQMIRLDQIEEHIISCFSHYNHNYPQIHSSCICGSKIDEKQLNEHKNNCVHYLNNELNELKQMYEKLKESKHKKLEVNYKTFFDEWRTCQEVKVLNSDMSAEKRMDAITIIKNGLNNKDEHFLKRLTQFFNKKYGANWHALVYQLWGHYSYVEGNFLMVTIGQKRLRLFKGLTFSSVQSIREARALAKPQIMKNSMNLLMTDDALTFLSRAVFVGENYLQIASLIRQRLMEKYGNNWNCLVSPDNFGLSFTPKQNTLINMQFGQIFVVIWQCP